MSGPTTYPGSTTPLRGLAPYLEVDRDALFARDADRDALSKLITQEGIRAALLFAESGVGRTSLLRAALMPHLRDHGVIAVANDDLQQPTEGFARSMSAVTGLPAREGEKAIDFLSRVVSQAMEGQLYVFLVDDVDVMLRGDHDGRLAHELGDLFARVATRSSGRARFLFSSTDARMHLLDALERRTGSLFPPAARYRLSRVNVQQATEILDKTFILAGVAVDPNLPKVVAGELGRAGLILPADLQILARAVRDLKITTVADLQRAGGAADILSRWVEAATEAAGDGRRAMRLLAELAQFEDVVTLPAETLAAQAGVEIDFGRRAMVALVARGLCVETPLAENTRGYALAHELLLTRIRELAAPARAGARRAREALGRAAARKGRMTLKELLLVRKEGIVATSAEEARTLASTKTFLQIVGGAAAAAPILLLIFFYVLLAGSYHLSVEEKDGTSRIVARAGTRGLRAFWWMPHSPSFGSVVADTGFTSAMVAPSAWEKVADGDFAGELDAKKAERGEYVANSLGALQPQLRGLVAYALASADDERALDELAKVAAEPGDVVALLRALRPIARGGAGEQQLVVQKLGDPSPAVQHAALELAAAVARRRPGAYREPLARAMASTDGELRRLAFGVARSLGADREAELLAAALKQKPGPGPRRDLLAALAARKDLKPAALAAAAVGILSATDLDGSTRAGAWDMMERAFERDAEAAAREAAKLAGDANAPAEARVKALELLADRAPREASKDISADVETAAGSEDPKISAAALPLFARVSPDAAAHKLVSFSEPTTPLRIAIAGAWGEVARSQPAPARAALEMLLADNTTSVKAAAARAYGNLGKSSQDTLAQLLKKEGNEVAEAAAWGLAASIDAGGSPSEAVSSIAQLWKKKGGARRKAGQIFARIARTRPGAVMGFLSSAVNEKDDVALRVIGVDGLCAALAEARTNASKALRTAADDESRDVRSRVAECVSAHSDEAELVLGVGAVLAKDGDASIRLDAARALAGLAAAAKGDAKSVGAALLRLVADADGGVRTAAARGLAALQDRAPRDAGESLARAWPKADETEKLALVDAARAVADDATVRLAVQDVSPRVRRQGLGAAVALRVDVAATLGAAFGDPDPSVRRGALELLGSAKSVIGEAGTAQALELAAADKDPLVAEAALAVLATIEAPEAAAARLAAGLKSPSEHVRVQTAHAAAGLAARDPKVAAQLLAPFLDDPAHDVRVAVVASLAQAYAGFKSAKELAEALERSERSAVARLVCASALLAIGADPARREEIVTALSPVADKGPALAQLTAELVVGLMSSEADGGEFLAQLIP